MRRREVILGAAALVGGCAGMETTPPRGRPLVIAHRGASGERPEHTLSAYRLACDWGVDYIEPDLVITRDGVLICRHENEISGTTDVAERAEFASRRTRKSIDGAAVEGWFAEDFTLAEIKTLRCRERLPELRPQNAEYDGQEAIPTFAEVLELAQQRGVGVYPELKHPGFLALAGPGLDPLPAFIGAVRAAGGQAVADRMFVQCFETAPLRQLASMSSIRWNCVQLIAASGGPWDRPGVTAADMISAEGLREIADYVRGIGVEKSLIIPRDREERSLPATDLVARAHAANLVVHAWTFRAENYYLPTELRRGEGPGALRAHGDLRAELRAFAEAGVDGVFTDFPGVAVETLRAK